jgi:hypothetical protein
MIMQFAIWIENLALFSDIRGSGYEYPILLSLHLVGLAFFGGLILITDLRLLGWILRDQSISSVVNALRWPKRIGFLWVGTCGFLLGMSKAEGYFLNTFFQLKMALLVLILIHAFVFKPSVYDHPVELDKSPQIPGRAKLAGALSLFLWLGVLSCGRGIGYLNSPSGLHYTRMIKHMIGLA